MQNIKKGDTVVVISGKREYKGKTGEVLEVQVEANKVLVKGINMVTKHVKTGETNRGTKTGGIETMESPPSSTRRPRRRLASDSASRRSHSRTTRPRSCVLVTPRSQVKNSNDRYCRSGWQNPAPP